MYPKEYKREIRSLGRLFKVKGGHAIIRRLLEKYAGDVMGDTKAAVVYSIATGLGLRAGKIMVSEWRENPLDN